MNRKLDHIVLLNLPNEKNITRRYMCSYNSPVSLFPPYELISVGGIIQERLSKKVSLIDAIAEKLSLDEVQLKLKVLSPDAIITITGFECYQDDVEVISKIKSNFSDSLIMIVGHYPTKFPKETLEASNADYVLHGEPDLSTVELIDQLEKGQSPTEVKGLSFFSNGNFISIPSLGRISNLSQLPLPAHNLVSSDAYSEPLLPKPFGVIQSARGCPYKCNFCVKSYGSLLTTKSPVHIVEEVKALVKYRSIKSFRFTDDTFTLNAKRVIEICKLMVNEGLSELSWSCLGRVENVNEEMITWMKKAGCKRIYFGIESGSPKMLKFLNKKTDTESAIKALLLVKQIGIQTAGLFMLGIPGETKEDVDRSIDFAIKARLRFIAISKFTPYPGTPFYEKYKDEIKFNIYPYKLQFTSDASGNYATYEKYFYKRFYLRMSYFSDQFKLALSKPKDSLYYFSNFLSYSLFKGDNALIHIQEVKEAS